MKSYESPLKDHEIPMKSPVFHRISPCLRGKLGNLNPPTTRGAQARTVSQCRPSAVLRTRTCPGA